MYANEFSGVSRSSVGSSATVHHHKIRSFSTSSLSSVGSFLSRRHATDPPTRSTSTLNLAALATRRGSLTSVLPSMRRCETSTGTEHSTIRLVGVAESANEAQETPSDDELDHNLAESKPESEESDSGSLVTLAQEDEWPPGSHRSTERQAFQRWLSKLRRKRFQQPALVTPRSQRWTLDDFDGRPVSPRKKRPSHHQKSASYASSTAFVTAVKSATATLASTSLATLSRRNSKWRRGQQRSSQQSDARPSFETTHSLIDAAAGQRSRKRREKIEELVQTEEGYVSDLKALFNVDRLMIVFYDLADREFRRYRR